MYSKRNSHEQNSERAYQIQSRVKVYRSRLAQDVESSRHDARPRYPPSNYRDYDPTRDRYERFIDDEDDDYEYSRRYRPRRSYDVITRDYPYESPSSLSLRYRYTAPEYARPPPSYDRRVYYDDSEEDEYDASPKQAYTRYNSEPMYKKRKFREQD